ncbi:hypothetical protein PTTG_09205 [Puccinia triticina 1-1 BBBD Race 1]|uniref:Uncharacterized protein n=1 Tax=Puccinia triticina (isolate 1-1 / race 1 (BBBD)) TaxID=630390 RepID=A0A180GCP2_PUCT1|nr:hypothetical protein PTTG_09205 [Puccinia triticina 1-1 BBBD Race 1]
MAFSKRQNHTNHFHFSCISIICRSSLPKAFRSLSKPSVAKIYRRACGEITKLTLVHISASLRYMMVSPAVLVATWLGCVALRAAKLIPQAQICNTYSNANTNHATCGKSVCSYGCSWPFVTAENCVPARSTRTGNTTSQTCHLGYWKESNEISSCITKFGSYKCDTKPTGFGACTGCRDP